MNAAIAAYPTNPKNTANTRIERKLSIRWLYVFDGFFIVFFLRHWRVSNREGCESGGHDPVFDEAVQYAFYPSR
jgi:hypothetical protein